ncbi:UNVERIFIED_CONTAM: hypothetical protein FKN15_020310 [Acipenser sinensis]
MAASTGSPGGRGGYIVVLSYQSYYEYPLSAYLEYPILIAQGNPSSKEEAGSQQGANAGREDEVRKGRFPGQAERMDDMGECGTMQDRLARPMDNGTEQDKFPHQINI